MSWPEGFDLPKTEGWIARRGRFATRMVVAASDALRSLGLRGLAHQVWRVGFRRGMVTDVSCLFPTLTPLRNRLPREARKEGGT